MDALEHLANSGARIFRPPMITVTDMNGNIRAEQPLQIYETGHRNVVILVAAYGRALFQILVDDLGVVRLEDNQWTIKMLLNADPYKAAMQLTGKIAEAVIVRRCHEDMEVNRKYLSKARQKRTAKAVAARYEAIGTGLRETQKHRGLYNSHDQQNDILWVNEQNQVALREETRSAGIYAGLQCKVSKNGVRYLLQDFLEHRYIVPVVYFDLSQDYEELLTRVYEKLRHEDIKLENLLVSARAVDPVGYDAVCNYAEMVEAISMGKLSIDTLVNQSLIQNDDFLKTAFVAQALDDDGTALYLPT